MQFAQRVKETRKRLGLTQAQLAERLGVTPLTVTRWEGGREPDELTQLGVAARLGGGISEIGGLSASDTLFGDRLRETFLDRPAIYGAASCGPGGEIMDPGPEAWRYALRRDFTARILSMSGGGTEDDLWFLVVDGESMLPTLRPKELVLLNSSMGAREKPRNNGIYLVRRSPEDTEGRVKRVRLDERGHRLLLASDNRAYPTIDVPLDGTPIQSLVLGRVCWVGRYLLETDPPAEDW